jgi:hypothetical protein
VGYAQISLSQLSTQYIIVPVSATVAGISYNPTSDIVQFAFMPTATQVPQSGDWVTGVWETESSNILYPYLALCLVGPAGTINPGIGTYVVYIRIQDNPEVPVLIAGQIQVQ